MAGKWRKCAYHIKDILGGDAISAFASKLGVGDEDAANGLADAIPQMVDKSSDGGSLLDSVGGLGGAVSMAKGLFG